MAGRLSVLFGLRPGPVHRAAWLMLVFLVVVMHAFVMRWIADRAAEFRLHNVMPPRIEVAYVSEMVLTAPPVVAPAPPVPAPASKRAAAARPAPAASAASAPQAQVETQAAPELALAKAAKAIEPAEPALDPAAPAKAPAAAASAAPDVEVPAPTHAAVAASAAASASAAAPEAAAAPLPAAAQAAVAAANALEVFDWPTSTRMSYALTGNYRGEVLGSAQVEWIRSGTRYQVHLDIVIGPEFAPLITRRMSSDGEITALGLAPRRYDEDTKAVFRDRRRVTMLFDADTVLMPSGERRERWPGVQDSASQFVQLTFMFTLNPELLRVGKQIEVPLALPKNIDRWTYEVVKEELLQTPFGAVPTFHVKPRRLTRPGSELRAEIWFAPQLRYLPARIRIEQDAETYVDLILDRKPQIAAQ